MKRKTLKRGKLSRSIEGQSKDCGGIVAVKGSLIGHFTLPMDRLSLTSPFPSKSPTRFEKILDSAAPSAQQLSLDLDGDVACSEDQSFILSQDFFCTPDYITPEMPAIPSNLDWNKENIPCPKSPEKIITRSKKKPKLIPTISPVSTVATTEEWKDLNHSPEIEEMKIEKTAKLHKNHSFVSKSAVALRCRVMPPPCLSNPYLKDALNIDSDPFGNQRSKCAGVYISGIGNEGLSRYRTDFHEIEKIGCGNFSRVFKVLKRIDGCMYAVKLSMRQLHQDLDRRKALMEVQALAALGSHENIVGYYSSWFENKQLYIQLELCDYSLSMISPSKLATENKVLEAMHQIAKALKHVHGRGIAHLDVKPDNIYVKDGVYKLGDFGFATLLDKSLPIEEGDARYMPQEILNENYDHLDKVDIFSLGASIFELVRGSSLPESGPHFQNIREGKLPLLPGHSLQFQNLLRAMMDHDPIRRPSAKELVENPIFDKQHRVAKGK